MIDPIYWLSVVLVFVTMISVLVGAHEYGHYLFARLFGMGVEEFAIGFGKKPLWTYARKTYTIQDGDHSITEETVFTIRPFPLGGFVRIKGMAPEEDGSETAIPGGFYSFAPAKRFMVLFAGPLFSVLAGMALVIPVYMFDGVDRPVSKPIIGEVGPARPADKAGLKKGDLITAVNDKPINTFYDLILSVRNSNGKQLKLNYVRQNIAATTTIMPMLDEKPGVLLTPDLEISDELARQYRIGVSFDFTKVRLGLAPATLEAAKAPVAAVMGIANMIRRPAQAGDSVGGPASIGVATATAVRMGFSRVVWLAAMLSISVGVFNLLPVYPLDGGQMMMALFEILRGGKRLSIQVQGAIANVGMGLVLLLVAGVFFVDFNRFALKPTPPKTEPAKIVAPKVP